MKKTQHLRRAAAGLLAAVMAFSLWGCSGRGGESPRPEDPGAETQPRGAAVHNPEVIHNDPVILEHARAYPSLKLDNTAPRRADTFEFYMENTQSMAGFIGQMSEYLICIQNVLGAAYNYEHINQHFLAADPATGESVWFHQPLTDSAFHMVQSRKFYEEQALPAAGALPALFRNGDSPFRENALTLLVSSFLEQDFNMNILARGIEAYFDTCPDSAACVVGLRSRFSGKVYVPMQGGSRSTFYIENFTGELPFYLVLVGPQEDVTGYLDNLFQFLDSKSIPHTAALYTNTVYDQLEAELLNFTLIEDHREHKVDPPVLSSYNTGELSRNPEGSAFFSTLSSVTTRARSGGRSDDDQQLREAVGRTTQISLLSDNYDGFTPFDWQANLYRYRATDGQWESLGAVDGRDAAVRFSPVDGSLTDPLSGKTLLEIGDRQMYLCASLNFSEGSRLSREQIYRMELSWDLNRMNTDASGAWEHSGISDFCADAGDYYGMIGRLCVLDDGNYMWTGTSDITRNPTLQAQARALLAQTPGLDILLGCLARTEDKYHPDVRRIQHLDLLFNLPGESSRR